MKWILLLGWEMIWAVQDFKHYRISRLFLYGGIVTGAAVFVRQVCMMADPVLIREDTAWTSSGGFRTAAGILGAASAAVLPGLLMLALSFLTEGKLGKADGYMVLSIGLFLGWELCMAVLAAACLLAALYAGMGIALKKLTRRSRICFAPFLLAATLLVWGIG